MNTHRAQDTGNLAYRFTKSLRHFQLQIEMDWVCGQEGERTVQIQPDFLSCTPGVNRQRAREPRTARDDQALRRNAQAEELVPLEFPPAQRLIGQQRRVP